MSLTGTPLIMTATLRWSNPLTLMRESPEPPPCPVAYTPGVSSRISGRSREPSLRSISALGMSEKATGVSRSRARSATTTISWPRNTSGTSSTSRSTAPAATRRGRRNSSYPMKLATRVWLPSATPGISNSPSRPVEVPRSAFSRYTFAPGRGSPVSASRTLPFNAAADRAEWASSSRVNEMRIRFMKHLRYDWLGPDFAAGSPCASRAGPGHPVLPAR